jgi:hypothetical protein
MAIWALSAESSELSGLSRGNGQPRQVFSIQFNLSIFQHGVSPPAHLRLWIDLFQFVTQKGKEVFQYQDTYNLVLLSLLKKDSDCSVTAAGLYKTFSI